MSPVREVSRKVRSPDRVGRESATTANLCGPHRGGTARPEYKTPPTRAAQRLKPEQYEVTIGRTERHSGEYWDTKRRNYTDRLRHRPVKLGHQFDSRAVGPALRRDSTPPSFVHRGPLALHAPHRVRAHRDAHQANLPTAGPDRRPVLHELGVAAPRAGRRRHPGRPDRQLERQLERRTRKGALNVEYRQLGASDLLVSEISLGSWLTYGVGVEADAAEQCVNRLRARHQLHQPPTLRRGPREGWHVPEGRDRAATVDTKVFPRCTQKIRGCPRAVRSSSARSAAYSRQVDVPVHVRQDTRRSDGGPTERAAGKTANLGSASGRTSRSGGHRLVGTKGLKPSCTSTAVLHAAGAGPRRGRAAQRGQRHRQIVCRRRPGRAHRKYPCPPPTRLPPAASRWPRERLSRRRAARDVQDLSRREQPGCPCPAGAGRGSNQTWPGDHGASRRASTTTQRIRRRARDTPWTPRQGDRGRRPGVCPPARLPYRPFRRAEYRRRASVRGEPVPARTRASSSTCSGSGRAMPVGWRGNPLYARRYTGNGDPGWSRT